MSERIGIQVRNVSKSFNFRSVVRDVSISIPPGGIVAIVGESGCGKSTVLRMIAGLEQSDAGSLSSDSPISIAFQDSRLLPWETVISNITLGLTGTESDRQQRGVSALKQVGLTEKARAWPSTLSGGEAQRAALARALVRDPEILLLDEPFGALDALTRLRMQALLLRLWAHHRFTVLLVTHDVDEAIFLADKIILLGHGSVEEVFDVPLARPRDYKKQEFGILREKLLAGLGIKTSDQESDA